MIALKPNEQAQLTAQRAATLGAQTLDAAREAANDAALEAQRLFHLALENPRDVVLNVRAQEAQSRAKLAQEAARIGHRHAPVDLRQARRTDQWGRCSSRSVRGRSHALVPKFSVG